jgi:ABC-type transport system involved in multi-copper enzyme maturation permease subunit
MNVLPVAVRELRAQARQPFTFWLRMLGVLALLGAGWFFVLSFPLTPSRGSALFGYMHLVLLFSVWVLVPLGAADCLSRERREGTMGLLFLTPLKPRDIVLAKGLTHGLRGVTLLIAVLPVLTIPFLIGGVSWQQAVASALANFVAICWALAAALVASSLARTGLRAMALAALFAVVAFFIQAYVGGLILGWQLGGKVRAGYPHLDLSLIGGLALNGIDTRSWRSWAGGGGLRASVLLSIVQSTLVSVLVLGAAVWFAAHRVRRSWQEEPPSARLQQIEKVFCQPVIWVSFLKRWMQWKLQHNPIGWLEQRHWTGRMVTWAWFSIIVSVQTTAMTDSTFFRGYAVWESVMAWLLTFSMAASAAGSFRRERETGVLELLLVSPLTSGQIIGGRLRALWGQFLPSIVLLLGVWMYFGHILPNHEHDLVQVWFFAVTYLIVPVIGLYFSVSCRHFITAFLLTLGTVAVAPALAVSVVRLVWHLASGSTVYFMISPPGSDPPAILMQLCFAGGFAVMLKRRLETRSFPLERGVA